jgi:hypothetical protein
MMLDGFYQKIYSISAVDDEMYKDMTAKVSESDERVVLQEETSVLHEDVRSVVGHG